MKQRKLTKTLRGILLLIAIGAWLGICNTAARAIQGSIDRTVQTALK